MLSVNQLTPPQHVPSQTTNVLTNKKPDFQIQAVVTSEAGGAAAINSTFDHKALTTSSTFYC